jgi:starvation-inducible DNA-binding protein
MTKNNDLKNALNQVLATEYVLYTKTQNYHWNVTGESFYEIHTFLEKQYKELSEIIDEIAEKVRSLEGMATGTLKEFLENSQVKEEPGIYPKEKQMLKNLLNDHSILITQLKSVIKLAEKLEEYSTNDFLIGLLEKHETMAWMLRSFVTYQN